MTDNQFERLLEALGADISSVGVPHASLAEEVKMLRRAVVALAAVQFSAHNSGYNVFVAAQNIQEYVNSGDRRSLG